uniref:Uncharacterized protein n=1 Tax=Lotharella oceanica TaxID=641309 RepID=A0A7S2XC92_9EUKA|mmetsp:Transcript_22461/g.42182  ORF Transcript_22461/g.42182 Transcript_22461/m.42182 type:complete len:316 (+) Transcript_22461:74-1021(+)
MEGLQDKLALTHAKTQKGKKESVVYYLILLVSFVLLITFYSVQEVTIKEQNDTGGDGCTMNKHSFHSTLGSVKNLPGDGDCYENIYKTINQTHYMNFAIETICTQCTTSPYEHNMVFQPTYIDGDGVSVTVYLIGSFFSTSSIVEIKSGEFARCPQAGGPATYANAICCTGTSAPGFTNPSSTDTSFNAKKCPTLESIKPNLFAANEHADTFSSISSATYLQNLQNALTNSLDSTVKGICRVATDHATYTCERKIPPSPISIIITALTLLMTLASMVHGIFANIYGPEAEDADAVTTMDKSSMDKSSMELKASSP